MVADAASLGQDEIWSIQICRFEVQLETYLPLLQRRLAGES